MLYSFISFSASITASYIVSPHSFSSFNVSSSSLRTSSRGPLSVILLYGCQSGS
uniref:Uncharacterized protein n=1 Tax=Arundo donax TaxID=35708 RepID=A0A0A9GPB9_ARUDO